MLSPVHRRPTGEPGVRRICFSASSHGDFWAASAVVFRYGVGQARTAPAVCPAEFCGRLAWAGFEAAAGHHRFGTWTGGRSWRKRLMEHRIGGVPGTARRSCCSPSLCQGATWVSCPGRSWVLNHGEDTAGFLPDGHRYATSVLLRLLYVAR